MTQLDEISPIDDFCRDSSDLEIVLELWEDPAPPNNQLSQRNYKTFRHQKRMM